MSHKTLRRTSTTELPRPFFVPQGADPASLPEPLQAAIRDVVDPAYRRLVLEARPGLEQSAGLTVVHLLWQEILEQMSLAEDLSQGGNQAPSTQDADQRRKLLESHLRLTGAKIKASGLLLRLEEFRFKRGPDLTAAASVPRTQPADRLPESKPGD